MDTSKPSFRSESDELGSSDLPSTLPLRGAPGLTGAPQVGTASPPGPGAGVQSPDSPPFGMAGVRHRKRRRPPKLYRIGELVDYCGVSRQTIHNYTTMGLLRETRWTEGGHRLYDEAVFDRLDQIAELKSRRVPLGDIREHFTRLDAPGAGSEDGETPPKT